MIRQRVVGALTAMTLAVGLGVSAVPTAQAAPAAPKLTWKDCPPEAGWPPHDPRMLCTTVKVPLDYRKPSGRTIEIAVSRLPTAKPGLRRGVLLHNGGGPGVRSLHMPSGYAQVYPQEVLDRYDLIGFDPRGIGHSAPVTCGRTEAGLPNELVLPFPAPDGSIAPNVAFGKALAADCLANGGSALPFMTTANTARDMDRIRAALGERRISYFSGSYGTYLGAVYAELFPERTDRFVLDSLVDPDRIWHGMWSLWDSGAELRFADFAAWASARHGELGLGATPAEVRANYLALAAKLDRTPGSHPDAGAVSGNLFRAMYRVYSVRDAYFPEIAVWWRYLAGLDAQVPYWYPKIVEDGIPADNEVAGQLAVVCGDVRWNRDPAYYQRKVTDHRQRYPLLAGMGANVFPCLWWNDPVEPPVRITDRGPRNVLLLQDLRDPATPYAGGVALRQKLGQRAVMVTVDAGNHGAYNPEAPSCAVTETHRFLVTGRLPDRDRFCRPDPVPAGAAGAAGGVGRSIGTAGQVLPFGRGMS
ncbi:alpha/beta hydrolase [Kitasatospora sp. NPDC096147]|uniref:alpha/beta hydrolase n=1 Tax=Kitasatospora sp. NPDC096147 TaxID=3364093 RepID=UPI0037F8D8FE